MTVKELDAKMETRASKVTECEKQIKSLEAKRDDAYGRMQEAAQRNDYPNYKAAHAEYDEASTQLDWTQLQLTEFRNSKPVTDEEVDAAWSTYAKEYNKRFDSMYQAYEKKRADLMDDLMQLINLQNEAFSVRERIAGYVDFLPLSYTIFDTPYDSRFPCRYLPDTIGKYFMKHKFINNGDVIFFIDTFDGDGAVIDMIKSSMLHHTHTRCLYP